ncbi:ankyrin-like protein [Vaccinia virus]|uniref:Ankyrin-like n=1 Tax=Vaccinia virus TaxID=10245 RepID=Q1M1Y5_VACCV|nr:ankyrin-like [Vaccinia virus]UMP62039.1 ankyrin-like [Vector synVACV-wt]UMP62273.1 ankyrin-like [Vector synVACV-SFV]UMP62507.1 ankyrin-like [Vector synVACV-Delta6]UMP62741.1 ankyrin-like [Vector synVACV-Delta5-6]UMP62975.1 ankyrin-like [Vector synVACV-Delta1-3]UMP63209.1 ankyrin-like [Vector synVACV-Delta3-6]UMP63443.1 ankyrin-like [Vector synVACV-Delta1Delta3-6]WPR21486.1 ankyrin-like protein [Vaccinia virus Lister]
MSRINITKKIYCSVFFHIFNYEKVNHYEMDEIVRIVRDSMWYIPNVFMDDGKNEGHVSVNNVCHMYFTFFDVDTSSHLFKLVIKHCDLNKRGNSPLHCYTMNTRFNPSVLKILLHHGMRNFDSKDDHYQSITRSLIY